MNATQKGLLVLIKSALTGEIGTLPEDFSLENAEKIIQNHFLIPLVYPGAINCGLDEETLRSWQMQYCRHMIRSMNQMQMVQRIYAAFDEAGIDYLPLKGCNIKNLYPQPEMRYMGDADILIRMEQYEQIRTVVAGLGFEEKNVSNYELVWDAPTLHLELHKRMLSSENKDLYAWFGKPWEMAHPVGGNCYGLSAEDEMLFLFTHFARHYREGGIGCSHVVDLWVYRRAHPEMDISRIRYGLECMHLLEFYDNIMRLLDAWFEEGEMDEKLELISDYVFSGGRWGSQQAHALSYHIMKDGRDTSGVRARARYIFLAAFPPYEGMKTLYPILEKAHWLLPAFWLYRLAYKTLFEFSKYGVHKKRLGLYSTENLNERIAFLRYVGLDYNY